MSKTYDCPKCYANMVTRTRPERNKFGFAERGRKCPECGFEETTVEVPAKSYASLLRYYKAREEYEKSRVDL